MPRRVNILLLLATMSGFLYGALLLPLLLPSRPLADQESEELQAEQAVLNKRAEAEAALLEWIAAKADRMSSTEDSSSTLRFVGGRALSCKGTVDAVSPDGSLVMLDVGSEHGLSVGHV